MVDPMASFHTLELVGGDLTESQLYHANVATPKGSGDHHHGSGVVGSLSPTTGFVQVGNGASDDIIGSASTIATHHQHGDDDHNQNDESVEVTSAELRSWYAFHFSIEPFWVTGVSFLSVIITAQAREVAGSIHGWKLVTPSGDECYEESSGVCDKVPVSNSVSGGLDYQSISQVCTFVSVALQLVVYLGCTSFADYGSLRKRLLIITNSIALAFCVLMVFGSSASSYWLTGIVIVFGNLFYGSAMVFYNAYLPVLVAAHPTVRGATLINSDPALVTRLIEQTTHQLSTYGVAWGFAGALVHLLVGVGMLVGASDQSTAARMVVALCGLWSLIFALPMILKLRTRPGPPLPSGYSYFNISWRTFKATMATRSQLPHTFRFLASYFLYSDAVSTIVTGSAVFAIAELHLSMSGIVLSLLEVALVAAVSGTAMSLIRRQWPDAIPPKRVIAICLVCLTIIPLAGLVVLTHQYEYFILSAWYGMMVGPLNSYTRSTYARLVPRGREAAFFSLYQITDKGSAWIGPLLLVAIQQATGSYRLGFSVVAVFFILALIILWYVDDQKGRLDARRFAASGGNATTADMDDESSVALNDDVNHSATAPSSSIR